MKIAIVGSHNYPELDKVREYVQDLPKGSIVVSAVLMVLMRLLKMKPENWDWK